ncbi:TBC1 domain family member 19 [Acipenser ruthenus]|uniref:TBC1 domain family member 19 n=1 Tax=Acipenser ruthenus TaxID=7906 RepID=A0A662YY80_ACIRT|nr:TBC1 domain family member 19 [Acipenser ruthenus]
MMDEGTELSVTIAQIVQKLKGSNLHSQLERQAKGSWEKRILKSLNSMCTELSIPLARKRPGNEQKELLSKWNEMGTDEPDLSHFRPVYAPKDFLEVLINLRNPNYDSSDQPSSKSHWGLIQVPLKVKDIPELRESFAELGLNSGQLGIDDTTQVPAVLIEQDSAAAEQYIRQGCPNELRAELWALILNATNEPEDILYYEQLKSGVLHHDLLVDNLIYKDVKLTASNDDYYFVFEDYLYQDVKLTASNDDYYFVFEDYLYQVLLCFSRDTVVLEHFNYNSATPPKSYIQGKLGLEDYAVVYPPNGVIPFHGFSMYVAPLCFLYNEPSKLYTVFREMYVRYFFRLHSISSFSSSGETQPNRDGYSTCFQGGTDSTSNHYHKEYKHCMTRDHSIGAPPMDTESWTREVEPVRRERVWSYKKGIGYCYNTVD